MNSKPPESAYPFKDFELGYPSSSNRISLTGSWTNYSTQQKKNKMGSINLLSVKHQMNLMVNQMLIHCGFENEPVSLVWCVELIVPTLCFRWSDGSTVSFVNWSPGEPNDFFGAEDCVEIRVADGEIVRIRERQRHVQQSDCSQALAKIPYTCKTNFGERS